MTIYDRDFTHNDPHDWRFYRQDADMWMHGLQAAGKAAPEPVRVAWRSLDQKWGVNRGASGKHYVFGLFGLGLKLNRPFTTIEEAIDEGVKVLTSAGR